MSNIIFAVLFTDKYSITEIREQYGEQQHTKKSICNLFCFPSGFFRPKLLHITFTDSGLPENNASPHIAQFTEISACYRQCLQAAAQQWVGNTRIASHCNVVFRFCESCIFYILIVESWSWKGLTRVKTLIWESRAIPNTQTDVLLSVQSIILRKGWSLMFSRRCTLQCNGINAHIFGL